VNSTKSSADPCSDGQAGPVEQIVYHPAHFLGTFLNAFQPELSLWHQLRAMFLDQPMGIPIYMAQGRSEVVRN